MTSDTELGKVLRMLGQAVYSYGIHSLDGDATDERGILDDLATEARRIKFSLQIRKSITYGSSDIHVGVFILF